MEIANRALLILSVVLLGACKGEPQPNPTQALVINEIVASNDGVSIDETGQTEDWIELANQSAAELNLNQYKISDSSGEIFTLPDWVLAPNSVVILWADNDTDEGPLHLPFKVSASSDIITLLDATGKTIDSVITPTLATNEAYGRFPSMTGAFQICRYASPKRQNGEQCGPVTPPAMTDNVAFDAFPLEDWPTIAPPSLGINELSILPAEFIELKNFGDTPLTLQNYSLALAPYPPTTGLPDFNTATKIALPNSQLNPGELTSIAITAAQVTAIAQQPFNEGIAVLFDNRTGATIDQVPFMHWPNGNALARAAIAPHRLQFCTNTTRNNDNDCQPLATRTIGDRTRGLYTPGDFTALASGAGTTNIASVKFIIDRNNDNAVHFPGAAKWPLHYTFVREIIDQDPPLNRCDESENRLFNQGWGIFSQENYSNNQTRRYHLGTLTKHPNADLKNVEFTFGDEITASQMRDVFYLITAFTPSPYAWTLRPQDTTQVNRVRAIEGTLPIVSPKAPFANLIFQGLAPGVAFGTLTFVETQELANTDLGGRVIVLTNDVPNDIDFVGGLITETFQTPLAHVNILSQSRHTPNMALPNARTHPDIAPLLDKLVRLEVSAEGYSLRAATSAEAQAFWLEQNTNKEPLIPRLDSSTTQLVDLLDASIDDIPTIGAKAAQLAELFKITNRDSICSEGAPFAKPDGAFAIPMSYYLAHFEASGARAYLDSLLADELFHSDINYRKLSLETLRQMIVQHPLNTNLLTEVVSRVNERFGNKRVRFRSSSNTEDLQEFNGAGLYTSVSAELDDPERPVNSAILTVWASLWSMRAFEERSFANVDQHYVAMAVLVHRAFTNERANGVAVSRNIFDLLRTDQYYFNSQAGEASVTNPAPGIVTEQLIYQWPPRTPRLTLHSLSNLLDGEQVISATEARALACSLNAIQNHFRSLLDPFQQDRWFTMETEFKFLGAERSLLIKQARPYNFAKPDIANDCREI